MAEQIVRPLPLVPSLLIALDELGESIADEVGKRIKPHSPLVKRVAFLRYSPHRCGEDASLKRIFPDRIGPSQAELSPGPVASVVWQAVTQLNEVEPEPDLLGSQGYYARLGSPAVYFAGELKSAAPPEIAGAHRQEPDSLASGGEDTYIQQSPAAAAGGLVWLAGRVQKTLLERGFPGPPQVALLRVCLPAGPNERSDLYRRMAHMTPHRLLALPTDMTDTELDTELPLYRDVDTPPLTYCYLFGDMDENTRNRRPQDIESIMALTLELLLTSALWDHRDSGAFLFVSGARDARADTLADIKERPRLGTAGASRLFYPRTEIVEYCAKQLALGSLLPRLTFTRPPVEGGSPAQRERYQGLEAAGRETGVRFADEVAVWTAPESTEGSRMRREKALSPSLSRLAQGMETDPGCRARMAGLLKGLEPSGFSILGSAETWLGRLDKYWPGDPHDPAAEVNQRLGDWWRESIDRSHEFVAQRTETIRSQLESAMAANLAEGAVQALSTLESISLALEKQKEQAEQQEQEALERWREWLGRVVSRTERERRRLQGSGEGLPGVPIPSGLVAGVIGPLAYPEAPAEEPEDATPAPEEPTSLPDFWRLEREGPGAISEVAIHDTYRVLRKRVEDRYEGRPRWMAALSVASMVVPLGYYVLRAFLPITSWPWHLQLAGYSAPLVLLVLVFLGIKALARHNLRSAGKEVIAFVHRAVVRKIEERDLRSRVVIVTNLWAEIVTLRRHLGDLLDYVRQKLPSQWGTDCEGWLRWPEGPSSDVPAVRGSEFAARFGEVERKRARHPQPETADLVVRLHERIASRREPILQGNPDQFGQIVLDLCREECARWLRDDTLAKFRPEDPAGLFNELLDRATPLLLWELPVPKSEDARPRTWLFAAPSLTEHPLVRAGRERASNDVIHIPAESDTIAVLRFTPEVWPRVFDRVPWALGESIEAADAGEPEEALTPIPGGIAGGNEDPPSAQETSGTEGLPESPAGEEGAPC